MWFDMTQGWYILKCSNSSWLNQNRFSDSNQLSLHPLLNLNGNLWADLKRHVNKAFYKRGSIMHTHTHTHWHEEIVIILVSLIDLEQEELSLIACQTVGGGGCVRIFL